MRRSRICGDDRNEDQRQPDAQMNARPREEAEIDVAVEVRKAVHRGSSNDRTREAERRSIFLLPPHGGR